MTIFDGDFAVTSFPIVIEIVIEMDGIELDQRSNLKGSILYLSLSDLNQIYTYHLSDSHQ